MKNARRLKRFHNRILLLFLLIVMLPMAALSIYLYDSMVESAHQRLTAQVADAGSRWMEGYETRQAQIHTLTAMIGKNPIITNYLASRRISDVAIIKQIMYSFRPMIDWLMTTNDAIYRIHFFTDNEELPEDKYVSQCARHSGESWFHDMLLSAGEGRVLNAERARPLPYWQPQGALPYVCAYQVCIARKPATYMQLDIAADWLYEDIPLVIDAATGTVLYSALNHALIGTTLHSDMTAQSPEKPQAMQLEGVEYYTHVRSESEEGLLFISLVPAASITSQLRDSQRSFLISCAVLAILMLGMTRLLAYYVTRRVGIIGGLVEKITRGEYLLSFTPKYNDEIDRLGMDVRQMGIEMDSLVNQGLRQTLLTKEAEFRALQAQINPHFIFNTLESFQMIAELEGLKNLSDMMAMLGKLMRYNLEHSPTATLGMEMENVTDYTAVQNLNMNGRIRLETHLDASLLGEKVLRLMLQPIVENAIIHGMPPVGELHITIDITRNGEQLRLRVANNGKRMSPEEAARLKSLLSEAQSFMASGNGRGIALQNIQRRLFIRYGADCVVHIDQKEDEGVAVSFVIPLGKERDMPCA